VNVRLESNLDGQPLRFGKSTPSAASPFDGRFAGDTYEVYTIRLPVYISVRFDNEHSNSAAPIHHDLHMLKAVNKSSCQRIFFLA
jgi:hypothetical protein